jgi:hypothetical protein
MLSPSPTTKYGEYEVAGTEDGTGNWTFMRQIMTPESVGNDRSGRWGNMRYSKASIYPGASGPGGYDTGWMGGLDYLELYRPSEIQAGDEIFSPFVAAGWRSAVETNMRPGQWLGFLKILTALGAEYVETGFFSPLQFSAKVKNVQLPQNYIWQAAAPAYAQATLSLWSELLFDGHLVDVSPEEGGMPSPALTQDCGYSFCGYQPRAPGQSWWYPELLEQYRPEPKTYRLWGGHGQGLVIIARKHQTRKQFCIVGTVQPQSNVVGNAPLSVTATIMLQGVQLNFTVRRQGSVYLYSPSSSEKVYEAGRDQVVAPPSFVQLDSWHESSHFSWWTNDFVIEAELHAAFQPSDAHTRIIRTEVPGWREGDRNHDFTLARAFVSLGAKATQESVPQSFAYEFEPRPVSRSEIIAKTVRFRTYRVELEMRQSRSEPRVMLNSSVAQTTLPAQSCVSLRLEYAITSGAGSAVLRSSEPVQVGAACVEGPEWQTVRVQNLQQLETARVHRLVIEVASGSDTAVDVDKLRLVEVAQT